VKPSPAATTSLVFLSSLLVAIVAVIQLPALGAMGGTTDEHFALGLKLRVTGTIGLSADEPTSLRPPGYPALVALATAALAPPPSKVPAAVFDRAAEHAVSIAQALLLAVGSTLLYLWLRPGTGAWVAAAAALAYATCPAVLVLCTLLHYSVLHAATLIAVCLAVDRTLAGGTDRAAIIAGLVTGAANLVRPVTLWLPAFAALCLWCRFGPRRALRAGLLMLLASVAVMTPWTVRNYRLTGRVLPVGDTGWHTLWAQTVRPLSPDPDRYVHFNLHEDIDRLFAAITGAPQYNYPMHVRHTGAVEQGFRADALANIRRQPQVYAANVGRSLASLVFRSSVVFVRATDALRAQPGSRDRHAVPQEWLRPGAPDVGSRWMATATSAALAMVGLLAAGGIAWSARRREPFGLTVLAVAGCVLSTHALAFVSMMHHYLRLPFLFAGAAVALQAARAHGGWMYAATAAVAVTAAILSLAVTAALMFAPA
jgi:hypothetical protein